MAAADTSDASTSGIDQRAKSVNVTSETTRINGNSRLAKELSVARRSFADTPSDKVSNDIPAVLQSPSKVHQENHAFLRNGDHFDPENNISNGKFESHNHRENEDQFHENAGRGAVCNDAEARLHGNKVRGPALILRSESKFDNSETKDIVNCLDSKNQTNEETISDFPKNGERNNKCNDNARIDSGSAIAAGNEASQRNDLLHDLPDEQCAGAKMQNGAKVLEVSPHKESPEDDKDNGNITQLGMDGVESENVLLVQRKWQMASCVHFLTTFKECLPLSAAYPATASVFSPLVLERAVGDPAADPMSSVVLRDVISSLLIALKELSTKSADRWFPALTRFVAMRAQEFPECFEGSEKESILDRYDGDGMSFIYHTSWKCRLGLLQSLCDIAAEEADSVRDVLREAERLTTATRQEVEVRHYRLIPLGRCSQKRFYYYLGDSRIYSGFKRKGAGGVCVECSDVTSMRKLVEALEGSDEPRDCALGAKICSWYLLPLEQAEHKRRRKLDRELAIEVQREESRRRNADRPRRTRAAYT